jgi:hypothetical protein
MLISCKMLHIINPSFTATAATLHGTEPFPHCLRLVKAACSTTNG